MILFKIFAYILVGAIVGFTYTYYSNIARNTDDEFITGAVFIYSLIFWPLFLFLLLIRFAGRFFNTYIFKQ